MAEGRIIVRIRQLVVVIVSPVLVACTAGAATLTPLYSFGNGADGSFPNGGLVQGPDGYFYGTTSWGGITNSDVPYGGGTVFKISPSGTFTNLHDFTGGDDGAVPQGGLILSTDNNFYGAANGGGTYGAGTVFEISSVGTLTTVSTFSGDGANSDAFGPSGIVQGSDGYFYGVTTLGGTNDTGTVFKVSPSEPPTTLYQFGQPGDPKPNAYWPIGTLVEGSDGYYGVTDGGANTNGAIAGTIFKITSAGAFTLLYSFTGGADGGDPEAGLILSSDGYFYGTTFGGGVIIQSGTNCFGGGTVFRISAGGALKTLYTFTGGADGGAPNGTLVQGSDGYFYGTTSIGGITNSANPGGAGTVFKISPSGRFTNLYSFTGGVDGANPYGALVQGSDGYLYGTTSAGGTAGYGTIFKAYPPPVAGFSGSPTNGAAPLAVTFTDNSSDNITNWFWDFGDGTTANFTVDTNPSHTYSVVGSYTVSLTVSGLGGLNTSTLANYIVVTNPPPVAGFSGSPTNGVAPLAVTFTDNSSGNITNWFWDFGDSSTTNFSVATNPVHTYCAGTYTVTLVVNGLGGVSTNVQANVVTVVTPFAAWQVQYFGCTNCPQAAPDADPLGKGMSNTNQFLAGLNPTNSASALRIISILPQGYDVVITWTTAGVRTNAVQATAGDANGGYTNTFSDISGSIIIPVSGDTTTNYTDVGGATNTPSRYYRIRLVP